MKTTLLGTIMCNRKALGSNTIFKNVSCEGMYFLTLGCKALQGVSQCLS